MDKSFQLIRTNPRLTTNIKLVIGSDYSIYLESFNSCKELSDQKYKHKLLNREASFEDELPKFYDGIPSNLAFSPKNQYDVDIMYNEYQNQFDNTYFSGADEIEDQWYNEEFEYFAPLYIKKNKLPERFIILRVDDAAIYELNGEHYQIGSLTKDNFREQIIDKWKCVSTFDLNGNNKVSDFLKNNINNNSRFPEFSFFLDTKKYNFSQWAGMNYNNGVYTKVNQYLDDKLHFENPHFNLEEYVTKGFQNNSIVYPFILNMKFLFDDSPATPDKFNKYSFNRYYGFYAEKFEHIQTITSYELSLLKEGVTVKNNIFVSGTTTVNPFVNTATQTGWVQYDKEVYQIIRLSNGSYKIISDINFNGIRSTDFNNNVCSINYVNGKNYITYLNDNLIIDEHKNIDNVTDSMYADLYLIDIDGIYHVLKGDRSFDSFNNMYTYAHYVQSDYAITSNIRGLKYWRGGIDNIVSRNVYDENNKPLLYKIYRVKFCDIKDFDFDRIVTKYSDFDYEKTHYVDTPEVKLYANEYRDNSVPLRKMVHDKGEDGQYKLMNISSEYSAGDETFELTTEGINRLWEKNQSICKWHYDGSISHSDYVYKMNNSELISGRYNRTTNVDMSSSNVTEKTLDYFYRIGELYGKKYDNIVSGFTGAGSVIYGWTQSESNWQYYLGGANCQSETSSGQTLTYTGDTIEQGKYYYVYVEVNITETGDTSYCAGFSNVYSFNNGLTTLSGTTTVIEFVDFALSNQLVLYSNYTNVIFTNILVKEIEDKYYLNQSRNIQTKLLLRYDSMDDDRFNLQQYMNSDFDYFNFFFNNVMYYENDGKLYKKPYLKYSTFGGGDNNLPSTSLFNGIEYKLYKVEDFVLNSDGTIRTILTNGGSNFNGYKMAVILNENYEYYTYNKNTNSEYTDPVYYKKEYKSINDADNRIDKSKNGIHVIVNDKFKNLLVIININIPFNFEWCSLNNVDVFGENYGLYYGKTKDNSNVLLPVTGTTTGVTAYDPNKLTAFYYMQALNNMNLTGVYGQNVTYYYITDTSPVQIGKVVMTKFDSDSTMSSITGWNKKIPPFLLTVSGPEELEIKKNSYKVYPIKGPSYNIYDKYMIYSNNRPLSQSIIDQPISRYIDVNYANTSSDNKSIKRFIGYYEPVFTDITMFSPSYYWRVSDTECSSISDNYVFADELDQFGYINEMMYSKVNEDGNYLKLRNVNTDRSLYPMVDEIGLSQTSRNIFLSTWDRKFYIKTIDDQTMLSNYVEVPVYTTLYPTSAIITSVSVSSIASFGDTLPGEYRTIYGYKKGDPTSTIDYDVTIQNTSGTMKSFGLILNYMSANGISDNVLSGIDPQATNVPSMGTYTFNLTGVNRPTEEDTGLSTYQEKTIFSCKFTCYELLTIAEMNTNNDIKYYVYNDVIGYSIAATYMPIGVTDIYESTMYNGFYFIVYDAPKNQISSTYDAKLYISTTSSPSGSYRQIGNTVSSTHTKGTSETITFNSVMIPVDSGEVGDYTRYLKYEIQHPYSIFDSPNTGVTVYSTRSVTVKKSAPTYNLVWNSATLGVSYGTFIPGDEFWVVAVVKNTSLTTPFIGNITATFTLRDITDNINMRTVTLTVNGLTINPNSTYTFTNVSWPSSDKVKFSKITSYSENDYAATCYSNLIGTIVSDSLPGKISKDGLYKTTK